MTRTLACLASIAFAVALPACVISDGDNDGDGGGTDDPSDSASSPEEGEASADDTEGESGADVTPSAGLWQYEETGMTTNDCTFIDNPSNGFGQFQIAVTGAGTMTILPGDATDPFQCTYGGGSYSCAERLTGMTDEVAGLDAVGNILVSIEGTIESNASITGTQNGHIECEGTDCGVAADALGVTFPCVFTIPFVGTAL